MLRIYIIIIQLKSYYISVKIGMNGTGNGSSMKKATPKVNVVVNGTGNGCGGSMKKAENPKVMAVVNGAGYGSSRRVNSNEVIFMTIDKLQDIIHGTIEQMVPLVTTYVIMRMNEENAREKVQNQDETRKEHGSSCNEDSEKKQKSHEDSEKQQKSHEDSEKKQRNHEDSEKKLRNHEDSEKKQKSQPAKVAIVTITSVSNEILSAVYFLCFFFCGNS